ncbi:hypothetical protein [Streptomyces sp. NPDC059009]|uniref:hypothetical protein n=1 Tax=Streptomyces sp. NPDC059009 TaxID=3346694 RepID=UPI0036CC07B8
MTTSGPRFTLDDSAADPDADIWFAEPAGFTAIPLAALLNPATSPAANSPVREALAPLLDAAPDDVVRQQFVARLAAAHQLLTYLCEAGTVHCSIGLHQDDATEDRTPRPTAPLLSLLTLAWRQTATAPPAITAARAVTAAEHHDRIEYLDLPCGPVTLSEAVRTPTPGSGLPPDPLLQVHAHLPHPDGKRLAVLTLSTTAVERRDDYRRLLHQVAELVSFENPVAGSE